MAEEQENNLSLNANEKVGSYLRRIREVRGLTLEQMAESIRMGKNILHEIEENNWRYFPTEAYLRSYIMSICEKLSLDKNIVIKKFSAEINSQFAVLQSILEDSPKEKKESPSEGFPKVAIIIVLVVIAILFITNKVLSGSSKEQLAPKASEQKELSVPAPDSIENASEDSIDDKIDTVPEKRVSEKPAPEKPVPEKPVPEKPVPEKPVAEKPVPEKPAPEKPVAEKPATEPRVTEAPLSEDVLRFECSPSPTDRTCGASLRDFDMKMKYFISEMTRKINRSDTAFVTITVPDRTRLFVNGKEVKYGKFNTLLFNNGEIIKKANRDLR
jgi:cytoskeletal protein RodZ